MKFTNKVTCSCISCKKQLDTCTLKTHYHYCTQHLNPLVPKNFGKCKFCSAELRGYSKKIFCNSSCAASYNNTRKQPRSAESRNRTSISLKSKPKRAIIYTPIRKCKICNKWFPRKKGSSSYFCGPECLKIRQIEYGRVSASKQKRRSKDEIALFKLCQSHFSNVTHNEPIFNGWDADIIIHDIKTAILWNGPWHYKEMKGFKHSLKQVQNRDRIKITEIESAGWKCLVFEDRFFTPESSFCVILEEFRKQI